MWKHARRRSVASYSSSIGGNDPRRLDAVDHAARPVIEALEARWLLSGAPEGAVPNGPFNTTALATSATTAQVSFYDNSDEETGFTITRTPVSAPAGQSLGAATTDTQPAHTGRGMLTVGETGLLPGYGYVYGVVAFNGSHTSSLANSAVVVQPGGSTASGSVPNRPFALSASATSPTTVNVSFYDNSNNETGFVIERATAVGGPFVAVLTPAAHAGIGPVTYADTSASAGNTYFYRVKAVNGTVSTDYEGPVSATTPASGGGGGGGGTGNTGTLSNKPFAISAAPTSPTSVLVTFYDNSNDEGSFVIGRSGGGAGATFTVGPFAGTGFRTFSDSTAAPNTTYTYTVSVVNGVSGASIQADGSGVATTPNGTPTPSGPPQAGGIDPTFGVNGTVAGEAFVGNDSATAVDGQILVAGQLNGRPAVGRYSPNGSPDLSYGSSGKSVVPAALSSLTSFDHLALQTDGKTVAVGTFSTLDQSQITELNVGLVRFNPQGSLDASFGSGGVVQLPLPGMNTQNMAGASVAVQASGKIVVALSVRGSSYANDLVLLRFNPNGSVDTSFGQNGIVTLQGQSNAYPPSPAGPQFVVYGLAIDATQRIVVVGSGAGGTGSPFLIRRFTVDGVPDGTTFIAPPLIGITPNAGAFYSVKIEANGDILATGVAAAQGLINPQNFSSSDGILVRYLPDGTLDHGFGVGGVVDLRAGVNLPSGDNTNGGLSATGNSIALQGLLVASDGTIFAEGTYNPPSGPAPTESYIAQFYPDGTLNTHFGFGGAVATVTGLVGYPPIDSITAGPPGDVIVTNTETGFGLSDDIVFNRYKAAGDFRSGTVPNAPFNLSATAVSATSVSLGFNDNSTNESGFVVERSTDPSGPFTTVLTLPAQAGIGAHTFIDPSASPGTAYHYRVKAINGALSSAYGGPVGVTTPSAGTSAVPFGLDGNFGKNGMATTVSTGVLIGAQPDGGTIIGNGSFGNAAFTRYTASGVIDTAFGSGGQVMTDINDGVVALQPDGKIIAAGANFDLTPSPITIERFNADGSVDLSFGINGVVTIIADPNTEASVAAIAIAADGKIAIVGGVGDQFSSGASHVLAIRLNANGTPDASFGSNGVASGAAITPRSVGFGPNDQIIVLGGAPTGIIRSNPNFSPGMVIFSAGGVAAAPVMFSTPLPADAFHGFNVLALQADGKVLIGGTADIASGSIYTGHADGFIARYNTDGSLDSTFGHGGVIDASSNPSLYLTDPTDLRLQPDGKILVGGLGHDVVASPALGLTSGAPDADIYIARLNTNGSLDTTFTPTGVIRTAVTGANGFLGANIAIDPDGSIVAFLGTSLARYVPAGTGNTSGVPNAPFGVTAVSQAPTSVALTFHDNSTDETGFQIDRAVGNGSFAPLATLAGQPGTGLVRFTDTTATAATTYSYRVSALKNASASNSAGPVTVTTLSGNNTGSFSQDLINASLPGAHHIAIEPDGKIIVEGLVNGLTYLARYNTNLTLDTSFGTGGIVKTPYDMDTLGIQPSGKIIIAGGTLGQNDPKNDPNNAGQISSAIVARYNVDGTLDTSFATNGEYRVNVSQFLFQFGNYTTLTVAPDGRIAISGATTSGDIPIPPSTLTVIVLNPDGTQTIPYNGYSQAIYFTPSITSMAFGPGDSLLLDGTAGSVFYGLRIEPAGAAEAPGQFLAASEAANSIGLGIAAQPDGKIVAVGTLDNAALIARVNNDLTPDAGFGSSGEVAALAPPGGGNLTAVYSAVLVQPSGKILAAGQVTNNGADDIVISRYTASGALDNTFASEGSIVSDLGGNDDQINALVSESDGSIIAAGVSNGHLALVRYVVNP